MVILHAKTHSLLLGICTQKCTSLDSLSAPVDAQTATPHTAGNDYPLSRHLLWPPTFDPLPSQYHLQTAVLCSTAKTSVLLSGKTPHSSLVKQVVCFIGWNRK